MRLIGTKYIGYPERRNFLLPLRRHRIVRIVDRGLVLNSLLVRTLGKQRSDWMNVQAGPTWPAVSGFHFWNGLSIGRQPWVSTLELPIFNYPPRPDALKYFAGDRCRQIIYLSQWCRRMAEPALRRAGRFDDLDKKSRVLHPPQIVTAPRTRRAMEDGELRFVFVGRAFFRKGGLIALRTLDRIATDFPQIRLHLISRLDLHDWPHRASEADRAEALDLIQRHRSIVVHHGEMANPQVLDLCRSCDVGLLPTLLDSFGYSVLEMMSCGLPVLCSDVQALPEIVTPQRGWLLALPNDPAMGHPVRNDRAAHDSAVEVAVDRLADLMRQIASDPGQIEPRGQAARAYIADHHQAAENAAVVEAIYEQF